MQSQRIPVLLYIRTSLDEASILTLQSLGYRLIEADDWEQAEVLCQIWQPDLLVANAAVPNCKLNNLRCVWVDPHDSQEVLAKAVNSAIALGTV